jgi:DnaJ-class molecular chaperone
MKRSYTRPKDKFKICKNCNGSGKTLPYNVCRVCGGTGKVLEEITETRDIKE